MTSRSDNVPLRAARPASSPVDGAVTAFARPIVAAVVQQHVDDSAALRHTRSVLVRAPHGRLLHLKRLDERIAAHLDGVHVAGDAGRAMCEQALESPAAGPVFTLVAAALEAVDEPRLRRVVALAAESDAGRRGLLAALGWWPFERVRPTLQRLLNSSSPTLRAIGLCAHRLHGADPGPALRAGLCDEHAVVRASALRAAGELGCTAHVDAVAEAVTDSDDPAVAYQAARSAVLLGRRGVLLEALWRATPDAPPGPDVALALPILAAEFSHAKHIVRAIARSPTSAAPSRRLVRAAGWLGDVSLLPWLIELTAQPALNRLAGESISMITGVDMAYLDLDRKPPAEPVAGPSDDPACDDVALDEDDSLPWPDPTRVQAWWNANADRFTPARRYFCGASPSPAHALHVLETGFQRQRAAAAVWLCLLQPGTPLFNIAAPAWRQRQALAALA